MDSKKPGRPRSAEAEQRILDAALRLLARDGYERMSLDEVAAEAGASKPTIYRRWASKADLATAALRTLQLSEPAVASGSTPGDLTATLDNFRRSLLRPNGMALVGTVLAEEPHTPELLALFRERLVVPRRAQLRAILERARSRGELRDGVNPDVITSALVGAVYARYLAASAVPASFAAEVVDSLWRGIAQAPAAARRKTAGMR